MCTWQLETNITLIKWIFVGKVMSLLFNTLSGFVIAFLSRSKCHIISLLQSPSAVILEPKKMKSFTASTFPLVSAMKLCLILVPGKFLFFVFFSSFTTSRLSYVCVHVELLQSCLTLFNLMDSSPSGSFVHGIPQARMLEWVAMPSSSGMEVIFMTQELNQHLLWFLPGRILYHWATGEAKKSHKWFYIIFRHFYLTYLTM